MQTTTKIILAVCSIGTFTTAKAQGFRYDHHLTWDGCPPGWTVQRHDYWGSQWPYANAQHGEYCARCTGAGGGFLNGYWNGCPPAGYSVREIRRRGGYDVYPHTVVRKP
jgi:hypothetical protein